MRESIERDTPDAQAKSPPDCPVAIRSALTCSPMRDADALRTTGAGRFGWARVTDAGSRRGRAVGNGEGNRPLLIESMELAITATPQIVTQTRLT